MNPLTNPKADMDALVLFENFYVDDVVRAIGHGGAEKKLAELTIELRALREDKARLDWLDARPLMVCAEGDAAWSVGHNGNFQTYALKVAGLRNAIDSARKATP